MWALTDGEWLLACRDGYNFVIPKHSGPQWLCEMTALATVQHQTINSQMKVWAITQTFY
jgi:hypothetical protein